MNAQPNGTHSVEIICQRYQRLYAALIVHDPRGIRITDVHVADTTHIPESVIVDLTAMIARMDTGRSPLVPDTTETDTIN